MLLLHDACCLIACRRAPLAIILEPSRDLAQQTLDELSRFERYLPQPGLRQLLLVGGQSNREQENALDEGVDIVVGTVGRISGTANRHADDKPNCRGRELTASMRGSGHGTTTDMVSKGLLDVTEVRFFILDEADELVAQGNSRAIVEMHRRIPKQTARKPRLQVCRREGQKSDGKRRH